MTGDGRWSAAAGAAALVTVAIAAGFAAHRRRRRRDPDRVGWIDWPAVQLLALIGAVLLASVAFNL